MQKVSKLDTNPLKKPISGSRFSDKRWPTRFPPMQFYIDQIIYLQKHFNYAPLYVHIFTDDKNPKKLVDIIKKNMLHDNIQFYYKEKNNIYDANVLDDLFTMAQYDCLIRPGSNFSKVAQLLGNHKIIIYPSQSTWLTDKKLLINKITVLFTQDPEIVRDYFNKKLAI